MNSWQRWIISVLVAAACFYGFTQAVSMQAEFAGTTVLRWILVSANAMLCGFLVGSSLPTRHPVD